jgi:hypothetical protein
MGNISLLLRFKDHIVLRQANARVVGSNFRPRYVILCMFLIADHLCTEIKNAGSDSQD